MLPGSRALLCIVVAFALSVAAPPVVAASADTFVGAWWLWPAALFVVCFAMGVVAVPAGIGGGTLFVPIVAGFFPFHLDFVRAAGLLVALSSALAAGPSLLRRGLADLRLALPFALLASASSIVGAVVGLVLPAPIMEAALGVTILSIGLIMMRARNAEFPMAAPMSPMAVRFQLQGVYHDVANGTQIAWRVHRLTSGALLFVVSGFLGGMFGVGAGWANVPTLNLVMGTPLKIAAGTSGLILSLASSSAAWVYLNNGAVLTVVAAPAVVGMMLGARVGAHLLHVISAAAVRKLVIVLLLFSGLRALLKGLGIWN